MDWGLQCAGKGANGVRNWDKHNLWMVKKYFVFGTTREKSIGISVIMCKKGHEGLKNNIRNIEKINKRIVHLKSCVHFNEICIQESLFMP